MSCTCKTRIETALLERFKQQAPDATGHQVELQGYGLVMGGNEVSLRPFMPAHATACHTPKSGGAGKWKKTKENMFFNHCPFCGARADGKPDPAMRERFETFFRGHPDAQGVAEATHAQNPDGTYTWQWKQGMWEAYQAALAPQEKTQ